MTITRVMVDLEGTLTDHDHRLGTLKARTEGNAKDRDAWKDYYKGLTSDLPREYIMNAVRVWIRDETQVIVYSTRFTNKYDQEQEWLRGHELWEHVDLIQRQRHEHAIEGPALVAQWAKTFEPDILVDDRKEVRAIVKRTSPEITVLGPDDFITRPAA